MSWSEVEAALCAPPEVVGAELLALPEGQWFDRKSGRAQVKDLAKHLVAFGNAEGGYLVLGLWNGMAEGVDPGRLNELRQVALDHTRPAVRAHVAAVPCTLGSGDPGVLVAIRVDPGESVHELPNGDCYLRVGDESRKLSFAQRQELHYDRGLPPFDGTAAAGVDWSDLDETLLRGYVEATGASRPARSVLQARSLLTRDDRITVAAQLLFGTPVVIPPHARVRVLRYLGTERGSGSTQQLLEGGDIDLTGPIPEVIHRAADAIETLLPRRRRLGGARVFQPEPIIPQDAWLEGLVNGVVHRSYTMTGDYVRVAIFDDRMEIESPGRFPGIVDPTRPLDIKRYARNPRITRVCADLRITQELGEGIARIFSEMRRRGLAAPIYTQTAMTVRLVLSAADAIPTETLATLPRGAQRTLDTLRTAGRPLGTGEILELAGITRPTATRHLNALRRAGLVSWEGRSAKDPRATWRLT